MDALNVTAPDLDPAIQAAPAGAAEVALRRAVAAATARIAPLWPLDSFVAVNPFLGLADLPFAAAMPVMAQLVGARMLMPRRHWHEALAAGRIDRADIAAALARRGDGRSPEAILEADGEPAWPAPLPLVSDLLAAEAGLPPRLFADRIAQWCAAYCDAGQAAWPMPWRDRPLYAAWRAAALVD
ncbi:putative inorganic carbon transporter subunit DabA, partial [Elioraea sp. Yellowstone]|uniref:putative inorganic carbon transporter subunit DabA n=1 Tax=Elioraea sp. Yellowstone TaxID=2592070 RepID=UPI001387007C